MVIMPGTILTVTANPALDKTYIVPGFCVDAMNRAHSVKIEAGGKGVNVSRWCIALGHDSLALGWLAGESGIRLRGLLHCEAIPEQFSLIDHETRTNTKIIDPVTRSQTEVNEPGPPVTESQVQEFYGVWHDTCSRFEYAVLSGSLPPGAPPDFYANLIRIGRDVCGIKIVLDTSGDALVLGAAERPWMLKPNLHESFVLGARGGTCSEAVVVIRDKYQCEVTVVTDGPRGASIADRSGAWHVFPRPIDVISTVGSGDAVAAGFVCEYMDSTDPVDALKFGVACGAANAASASGVGGSILLLDDIYPAVVVEAV